MKGEPLLVVESWENRNLTWSLGENRGLLAGSMASSFWRARSASCGETVWRAIASSFWRLVRWSVMGRIVVDREFDASIPEGNAGNLAHRAHEEVDVVVPDRLVQGVPGELHGVVVIHVVDET